MSKHETHMTRWYWQQIGGTLVEEFPVVKRTATCAPRYIDGVIIRDGEQRIARAPEVQIEGKDVIVVQTKAARLGMSLMGQAFFSAALMARFRPRSVHAVALCNRDDSVLRPLLEAEHNVTVVVYPPPAPVAPIPFKED